MVEKKYDRDDVIGMLGNIIEMADGIKVNTDYMSRNLSPDELEEFGFTKALSVIEGTLRILKSEINSIVLDMR